MKFFHILIYKYYQLAILLGNEGFYPEINAWFLATLMPWLNFVSLIILLKVYFISFMTFKVLMYSSGLIWILTIYHLVKNKQYRIIITEVEKESRQKSKTILTIIYSALSVTIYLLLQDK